MGSRHELASGALPEGAPGAGGEGKTEKKIAMTDDWNRDDRFTVKRAPRTGTIDVWLPDNRRDLAEPWLKHACDAARAWDVRQFHR